MIYYIYIVSKLKTIPNTNVSEYLKNAIYYHSQIGNKEPSLINEPCMFALVNDSAAIKKLGIKTTDSVRLAINNENNRYNRYFNIEDIIHVKTIFDELKELNLNISPNVVYA